MVRVSASESVTLDGVVAAFPGWTLVEVTGSHRERFLASQVTSDVAALPVGESQLSALLDRSGRLQAFFFLHERADSIELLVPDAIVDACIERLDDHVIADDVNVIRREVGSMRLALGPAAAAEAFDEDRFPVVGWGTRGFVTWNRDDLPWPDLDPNELETLRTLGGPPLWGCEVRADQLINETVLLEAAVSFDKGCYLGQETVAKVASRRGAVRGPVVLELVDPGADGDTLVGSSFGVGERPRAGEVLSSARLRDKVWLSASLHRELRVVGREIRCVFEGGQAVSAVIHDAPLLPPPTREELADRLTTEASASFARDRNDRALELLERATAICPGWADAHEATGVILGRIGRHREAIEAMERLLEIDPSSVMAHSNLSLFHNQLGDVEQAEHHLAMATRASMGAPSTKPSRSSEEVEADRRRREGMFLQVLEIDPDDALAHFGLGELALERERFTDAVEHLERAIAGDPTHAAAILALGAALEALGDHAGAHETYERGVEIAAKKGDTSSATKMQERINALAERAR